MRELARLRANNPARRLCFAAVLLVVVPVAVAGIAWACVPSARVALSKTSGAGGAQVTITGTGFPSVAEKIDLYVDNKDAGSLVLNDFATTDSGNGERGFSTQVTTPTSLGAHVYIVVPLDGAGTPLGTGTIGAGPPGAVYQVTDPSLSSLPGSGRAGTSATVTGQAFRSGSVRLRWDSASGPLLGTATATGANFGFSKQVTIPAAAAGAHKIVGVPLGDPADTASANFEVLPPASAAPQDSVGPAIAAAALASRNGTKTVSKRGALTIFCGEFDEAGVTGECGARSVKKLKVATASRSAVLRLRAKSFTAASGKPVMVKFRLKKASLKMLRKAKKVRMRGTVSARDANGNATPAVNFRFSLKAPKRR